MKIVVCLKRVLDTQERVEIAPDGKRLVSTGLDYVMNTHDECAVEEAIRIKEAKGGQVTVLSLGPSGATETIREAIAMGADEGLLLEAEGDEEAWGPKSTASALAEALKGLEFDLVFFGLESGDGSHHQVGLAVAEALGLPAVDGVKKIDFQDGKIVVRRAVELGEEVFELEPPAVLTLVDGMNRPRHPSLRGIMLAKRKEIKTIKVAPREEPLRLIQLRKPPERAGGEILGEGKGAIPKLLEKLHEAGLVR
ncbi:MAG: electron transfer flavoprotein subunit beta/FixA family protein [Candidatus Acetothermia bacterium]|nr:electron transfer flavoprotein subunit beta/FixA family protein [Candidatus Acetothermia bacterium]MDH7504869.1 electron transfer flavoprotein subunit beta/FixA family protein [Candidatus Acetothermia bacterium]